MRKLTIFTILLACLMVVAVANAENQIITGTVTDKIEGIDVNGNPMLRIIASWEKELNGVKFNDESVCMAFGADSVAAFNVLKIGQTFTAIANYRKLADGRESYTLKKLLPVPAN